MRFAAKEAFAKAAGLGMVGLAWREIEIVHDRRGKPGLILHGRARAWADQQGITGCFLSLSDEGDYRRRGGGAGEMMLLATAESDARGGPADH